MKRWNSSSPVRLALAASVLLLGGCSVFQADRQVHSTLTLEPGQSLAGEIWFEDGGDGFVQFASGDAKTGHPRAPSSWYYSGDPDVRIAFPDSDHESFRQEHQLGFASYGPKANRPCRVVVRNAGSEPKEFHWIVKSRADAVARWVAPHDETAR